MALRAENPSSSSSSSSSHLVGLPVFWSDATSNPAMDWDKSLLSSIKSLDWYILSVMYLSLGEAARKQFMDKYPHTALWELKAQELITLCNECFRKKRNRTLDRHRFFSRLQQPGESLFQFWHALNGPAALCDFDEISTTLVLDMFILHMNNKKVQEKLCTRAERAWPSPRFRDCLRRRSKEDKSLWNATGRNTKNDDKERTGVCSGKI